jgi:hypothetical protein
VKVVAIFKPETDYARTVTDFLHDFKAQTGHDLEIIDPESPAGVDFCKAYDILQFPTLVAMADDGTLQTQWQGLPLPTISEVSYYVQ